MKSAPALGSLSPPPAPRDWHATCPGVVTASAQAGPHPQPGETAPAPGRGGGRGGDGEVAAGAQGLLQELSEGLLLRGRRASCSRTDLAG